MTEHACEKVFEKFICSALAIQGIFSIGTYSYTVRRILTKVAFLGQTDRQIVVGFTVNTGRLHGDR